MLTLPKDAWYYIEDADTIDSPALVVFPERVKANIALAIDMVGSVDRLRPHVKTNKSPDACMLMLKAGITRFKCATIAEAEMLAMIGAPDVLFAYQPVGPKLTRFLQLVKEYAGTNFSCLVDGMAAAAQINDSFSRASRIAAVYIDLNTGMDRTGIAPENAMELAEYCDRAGALQLEGLHHYDGHIRGIDLDARTQACETAFGRVESLGHQMQATGIAVRHIVAGGSPTFPLHARRPTVECSPGTFIYWDQGYLEGCPEQHFLPAAVLLARVISTPSPGKVCIDLGHKSVAAENEIGRRVHFLNTSVLNPVAQSEEHLVCEMSGGEHLAPGSILAGLPFHICPTVALYERVFLVENGKLAGEWLTTARDRRISI
ncbi:MAG TPA: D-TA family PLP-dependent enzyme [Chitinophagaceae bacterium]